MNFTELQNRLAFVLNFNDTQTDSEYTTARLKQSLNYAYEREVIKAEEEGSKVWFKSTMKVTWPKSQLLLTPPEPLKQSNLIKIEDITNTNPGVRLSLSADGLAGDIHWADRNTLQWSTVGPSSARSLRFHYYARATEMSEDEDIPELIPPQFHEMIVWSAAIFLRDIADESAPGAWQRRLQDWQIDFYKYLSRGRPTSDVVTVDNTYSDGDAGFIY